MMDALFCPKKRASLGEACYGRPMLNRCSCMHQWLAWHVTWVTLHSPHHLYTRSSSTSWTFQKSAKRIYPFQCCDCQKKLLYHLLLGFLVKPCDSLWAEMKAGLHIAFNLCSRLHWSVNFLIVSFISIISHLCNCLHVPSFTLADGMALLPKVSDLLNMMTSIPASRPTASLSPSSYCSWQFCHLRTEHYFIWSKKKVWRYKKE